MASGDEHYGKLLTEGNPSQVKDDYWIWAVNGTNKNNRRPDYEGHSKCGKWLIFEDLRDVDQAWEVVKNAVVKGKLGHLAKVSTMKDKEERGSASQSVICVYTYDWTDEGDVKRVRNGLRALGFEKKLPYKSDEDTIAGLYSARGQRVSKYYY